MPKLAVNSNESADEPVQPSTPQNSGSGVKSLLVRYAIVIVLLVALIVMEALDPAFLSLSNIQVIMLEVSTNALLAIGATFVILTSGIDLSVGSIVGLSGVVAALAAQHQGASFTVYAVLLGVLSGVAIGAVNGFLVSIAKVPPFIVTLGTMTITLGLAYVLSNGEPISNLSNSFLNIGSGSAMGVPIPIVVMVVAVLVFLVVLTRTRFGMHVYAVGGNIKAARIAGVRVNRVLFLVYVTAGALAGLAGVILASRVTAGIPTTGSGYELDAIAATVIGGTSLMGGRGTLTGTVIGFLIIGILNNGLNLLNVSPFYQDIVKGVIIVGAVFVDSLINNKKKEV